MPPRPTAPRPRKPCGPPCRTRCRPASAAAFFRGCRLCPSWTTPATTGRTRNSCLFSLSPAPAPPGPWARRSFCLQWRTLRGCSTLQRRWSMCWWAFSCCRSGFSPCGGPTSASATAAGPCTLCRSRGFWRFPSAPPWRRPSRRSLCFEC